ncbi:hypothetical protein PQQ51_30055, partial [Paraburkholderia xenovorans]|uniref:OTU domain-containing protein n=1 Tax=Paraburkholderia xenovorans TaxID=36873 RepID=UPI0038B9D390
MRSYAEKDSTSKTKRRRDDELEGQHDIAESRWFDQAERIGRNGEWNFELADSMPFLISELPCWKEGGLALYVWNGGNHTSFGESTRSAGNVYIEVAGGHYWALINGEKVWIPADGNCFFNAIWKSLQACGDMDAVRRIFRGNVPANEREASDYFRREIRRYAFDHPELEAILLGDADGPADPWRARRSPPGLRQPDAQPECKSSKVGDVAGSAIRIRLKNNRYSPVVNGKALPAHSLIRNRAPVVETSGVPGDLDETDIDEFFDAPDTAEWLVQAGRPAVHAAGPEGGLLTPENSQTPMSGVNRRSILYKRPTLCASESPRARKTVRWNASLVES